MKRLLLLTAMLLTLQGWSQIKVPAPSPGETLIQDFGLGKIEVTYSRPSLKGRVVFKEKSELAPLAEIWRTGANAATKISFSDNVTIGGKSIDTGAYALYTIPGKEEWTIILNKGISNWGTNGYKESDDIVRFTVKSDKMKESMETFTMQFADVKPESCELHLMWGNIAVRIPITTNVKEKIRAQVEKALTADNITPGIYQASANFYYEWDKDLNKALTYATKATTAAPNAYYLFLLKARIEKDLGDKVSAKADAQKCINLATDQKNPDYVRMAKELIAKL